MEQPPEALIQKAFDKMNEEKSLGKVDLFEVYHREFIQFWEKVRLKHQAGSSADVEALTFTLACGSPRLTTIKIDESDDPKIACLLSINAQPHDARQWRFDFLKININHEIAQSQLSHDINFAQVYACWIRLCRGEKILYRPISPAPKPASDSKLYSLLFNKGRGEIGLTIYSATLFHDTKALDAMVQTCADSAKRLAAETGKKTEFLKTQLIDRLKSARRGPEAYDCGLPAVYLVAYPQDVQFDSLNAPMPAIKAKETPPPVVTAVAATPPPAAPVGLIRFKVDPAKLFATIESFDLKLYDHPDLEVSLDWLMQELKSVGISFNSHPELEDAVRVAIESHKDLTGMDIAKGIPANASTGPSIRESYRLMDSVDIGKTIDIREMQQRRIVNAGDLIAEVVYKNPGNKGKNVYGIEIPEPPSEAFDFTIGEGIDQRGLQFFARTDGLPKIENNVITLSRALVHEGDVNLKTGNIRYNGSAEIKGSIDTGATVEVTGDLIVHGTIQDAFVRVGGNLEVRNGIVTGEKGIVRVKHDIKASFIENSHIICNGSVIVKKAILNSRIASGQNIQTLDKTGIIAGGVLTCGKNIQCGNLGFKIGTQTQISCGINWKAKLSFDLREQRLAKLASLADAERANLRELMRKKDGQKTKKHEQMIKDIQSKLTRMRDIQEKLKKHVDAASRQITHDLESRIYVLGTLFTNLRMELGGVHVPVSHEVLEVVVSAKKLKGQHINPLSEIENTQKAS